MADTKISAMTAATQAANADELPFLQGGANKKVTRDLLLKGAAGEDISLAAGPGQFATLSADDGNANVAVTDGGIASLFGSTVIDLSVTNGGATSQILVDNAFGINLVCGSTKKLQLQTSTGGQLLLDETANSFAIGGFSTTSYQYVAGTGTDWNAGSPNNVTTALDRCAALLKVLNGGTGP